MPSLVYVIAIVDKLTHNGVCTKQTSQHANVGFEDGDNEVRIEPNVSDHCLHCFQESIDLSQYGQRIQCIDQRQRKTVPSAKVKERLLQNTEISLRTRKEASK